MKIKVTCELSGACEIELDPDELEGMTDNEISDWVMEGAHIEFWEQRKHSIRLADFDHGLKELRSLSTSVNK